MTHHILEMMDKRRKFKTEYPNKYKEIQYVIRKEIIQEKNCHQKKAEKIAAVKRWKKYAEYVRR